ncbi:hypothetical protein QTP88_005880 [Uroleucon formosanum]
MCTVEINYERLACCNLFRTIEFSGIDKIVKTDLNSSSSLLEIDFPTFLILSSKFLKMLYLKRQNVFFLSEITLKNNDLFNVLRNNCKILQPSSGSSKKLIFNYVKSKIMNWDTIKYNEKWLNLNFNIALPPRELHCNPLISEMSLPSTSTASVGRPIKPFIQNSDKTKRRKIKSILNENSNDKIIFATKTILYSDGNRAAADLLKQSTEYSPQRALKIKHTYNNRLSVVKSYTADEALALIIDAKLTKFSYSMLKKGSFRACRI